MTERDFRKEFEKIVDVHSECDTAECSKGDELEEWGENMLEAYEDERKFRDHIQAHLTAMHIEGEVICKICGRTAKDITGRD